MRILQIINSTAPAGGGPIEAIVQAHHTLEKMGHETEVACLDVPHDSWLADLPMPVFALGPAISPYRYATRFEPWLKQNAHRYDCAIVHGIWLYPTYGTWRVCRQVGLPFFVYSHGSLDPQHKKVFPWRHLKKVLVWNAVERRVLKDADAVFFTCEEERDLAGQAFKPFPCRDNNRVIPYAIGSPPDNISEQVADFYQAFPHLTDKRVVLFLSRVHPKKGCDLLIEAFAKVAHRDDWLHLVIAGDGPDDYRTQLEKQSRRLGIADRITWTGRISGNLKWGAFRTAEAFALPSHQENFGIAVVEALATDLPVLISKRINIWDPIIRQGAGLACEDTTDDTQRVLNDWLSLSAGEQETMRQRARTCFEQEFCAERSAELLLNTLQEAA